MPERSLVAWRALTRPDILASVTHFQLPHAPGLWSRLCREQDPGTWPRTRDVAQVTCPRCLWHGARTHYLARLRAEGGPY